MKTIYNSEDIQKFIYAVEYGEITRINSKDSDSQSQILDYFIQLLRYFVQPDQYTSGKLHVHIEFFAIERVKKFFTDLFSILNVGLCHKAEEVFQSCYAFIIDFNGSSESRSTVYWLIKKLKERFPHLSEMYDKAIAGIITEFFRPTIGEFLNQHESAVNNLKTAFPFIYTFFITPLSNIHFIEHKLFNFFCDPCIYHKILNYLANCLSSEIDHERLEMPLLQLEKNLKIIRSQTSDESWQELTHKACKLLKHSEKLEAFAIASFGLYKEIKNAAQFFKSRYHSKDILVLLPEKTKKNCDWMVICHKTGDRELIEHKAKIPRHGLDPETAGDAQVWDDFFSNFVNVISSYLNYLQKILGSVLGLKLTKCFPFCEVFEGSNYGVALPLINDILQHPVICDIPMNKWSSKQKLIHLLSALFLRPLIFEPCCVPLSSDDDRLKKRQQATESVLHKKEWVNKILKNAIQQLENTYQHQKAEGHRVVKMYVLFDLNLSYRLLQDPFSYYDGNIDKVAERVLHDLFQPYKDAFLQKNLNLDLLIIQP